MDADTVLRWAWPRSGGGVEAVCWRQRLHEALHAQLGREPTMADLQYRTVSDGAGATAWHRTTVDVTPFAESPLSYEGATCARQTTAINSAAWVALMDLCNRGFCAPPPEVAGAGNGSA